MRPYFKVLLEENSVSQKNNIPKVPAETIITAHMNADFDCLAAMVAAGKLYPEGVLVFPGSQEKNLKDFFIQSAIYMFDFKSAKEIDFSTVKRLVVVDTRQRPRLRHVEEAFANPDLEIHVYDHHPDTDEDVDADVSFVLPWGSASAVVTAEIMKRGLTLTKDEATMIGLGIYEDTGSFSFSSTTTHDFDAAAYLLSQGMELDVVAELTNREMSAEQVKVLNDLIESAQTHEINSIQVVVAEVSINEYFHDFALLAHKLLEMENIKVLFALGRMGDHVQVVARSKDKDVDVGRICKSLGGGGHSYAASAAVKDKTLPQVRDELFALLYSEINPQLRVGALMSKPAVTANADQTIRDAVDVMTRFGLKALPILDPETKGFVGILEHDIADKAVSHKLGHMPAVEYITRKPTTIDVGGDLYEAVEIILGQGQRLVPVIDTGKVVGVITRTDLVNLLIEEPARIPESLLPDKKRERSIKGALRDRLPEDLLALLHKAGELAESMGFGAFVVGGFVRDLILHVPNLDVDFVIEGDGIEFAEAFAKEIGGRVRAHKKFKTAVVILPDGSHIDVATARLEYYEYPAALPTVELSSIKMDLFRRDFSINALAVHLNPKQFGLLADFFGGRQDLKEGRIRVLHSLSFVEDPTRILRAVRFEQRYGFAIGAQTERLIRNALQLDLISKLSGKRIFNELELILVEPKATLCLRRLKQLKVLKAIHPKLDPTPAKEQLLDEMETVLSWYRLLYSSSMPDLKTVFLLVLCDGMHHDDVVSLLKRFDIAKKKGNDFVLLRKQVAETLRKLKKALGKDVPHSELYFMLEDVPLEAVLYIMAKSDKETTRKRLSNYLAKLKDEHLQIDGKDLMQLGVPSGPLMGEILRKLKAALLDDQATCRADQLELAKRLLEEPQFGLTKMNGGEV